MTDRPSRPENPRVVADEEEEGQNWGAGLRTRERRRGLIGGVVAGLLIWQILATVVGALTARGETIVPHLLMIFTEGITGLSPYYQGGWRASTIIEGSHPSVGLAALALAQNGLITLGRFWAGYLLAVGLGIPAGLLVAASTPVRQAVAGLAGLLRMLPLLALSPLFTLWFGASSTASVLFVTFGAFWVVLLSTANAVKNLPVSLVDYPRTLGMGPVRLRTRVVLPAIGPELRGPLMLAAGTAWACVLASELYGVQSGLGWALNQTLVYTLVPQMLVVAGVFAGLSWGTLRLVNALTGRLTRWSE